MKVLIDTSAWVEFFRAQGDSLIKSKVAEYLNLGQAVYTCPISFELFLGARPSELADLREGLGFAHRVPLNASHWDLAAQYGAKLRQQGITVPASDLLIATVATESKTAVLSLDNHFQQIRNGVLGALCLL